MERRGFLQALSAGAAMVMLPSLASAALETERVFEFPMNTTADLTAWMQNKFRVFAAMPAAFMEVKAKELPKLYGFGIKDIPDGNFAHNSLTSEIETVRFTHRVMAYGIEGDDPVEAEKRLVQAMHKELSTVEGGIPVFLRVEPQFTRGEMIEFGETWKTPEQMQDSVELLTPPQDVEYDFDTDSYKYVKRKYTLNKLRVRLSFPTLPYEREEALCTIEGMPIKRI